MNKEIKRYKENKSSAPENNSNENKDIHDKLKKVSENLKNKSKALKESEQNVKELTESLSKAQKELNIQVNKAAKAETENVRAGKINKKLEEICDNKGVFERKEPARRSKSSDDESKKSDKRFRMNNRSRNEK